MYYLQMVVAWDDQPRLKLGWEVACVEQLYGSHVFEYFRALIAQEHFCAYSTCCI